MSERHLKRTILDHEEELRAKARATDEDADTARALLAWARGEEMDSTAAKRIVERAGGT